MQAYFDGIPLINPIQTTPSISDTYGPLAEVSTDIAVVDTPVQPISVIAFQQEKEGIPSLSNVRNITGYDVIILTQQGQPDLNKSYSQPLSETVYGGEYDWSAGILTVTHKMFALSVDDMDNSDSFPGWKRVDGLLECFAKEINGVANTLTGSNIATANVRVNTTSNNYAQNQTLFFLQSTIGMTQTEIQSQYAGIICQFLFPLLEPKTMQFPPQKILAFENQNILSSNCGNTIATFQLNLKKYIDKKIEEAVR